MKKFMKPILMATLAIFLMVSMFGCYGNFVLTQKLYKWNGTLGNKYINNFAFWILSWAQVYSAAVTIDYVLLNTVEFWTGSNPLAMKNGEEKVQYTEVDGSKFKLRVTNDSISIEEIAGANVGKKVDVKYDAATQSWYLAQDSGAVKIATMNGDKMNLLYPSGNHLTVDVSY